jgi:6-phosphogluconolactonase (cycloisomerase 2 family)
LITELAHEVFIYPVPFGGADVTALYPEGPTITPSQIPVELKPEMTAGEIILHPVNDRVLYISNRGQVDLNEKSGQDAKGDAVAVVTLNEAGDQIENVDIVPTDINFIRGMKITSDGKYLGLVGQKDGKVAVYETGGKYGEKIELVAKVDAGLNQPTDVTWI